jgi:acetylornithine deacetylase/succinyl-diaminopimelate desuccinylase-like protein
MPDPAAVLNQMDADFDEAVGRLAEFLRIPSISTDPAYAGETRRCAEHIAADLRSIGFETSVRNTPGHPMVVGHSKVTPGRDGTPTILYYGHYDVQPPDPLELWNSPPFEPAVVEGPQGRRIVARGAVDDKGQVMTFIEAFRAWKTVHGSLPFNIIVLLEGEEESGSPSLDSFLRENREELQADVCIVSDTGMWNIDTPAITYMLRGLCYVEITLHGPSHDLHSGMYGGSLVNPLNALCGVLAQLHDADRRVQIPGFYDDVIPLTEEEREQWRQLNFDEAAFLASAGMKTPFGERGAGGWSTLERIWARPTCDINGIYGGYTGKGAKTVIGCSATAKVSCRLVADQNPRKIYDGLVKFLNDRTPPDCRWEVHSHGISPAIRVPTESPHLEAAMRGLERTFKRPPVLIGSGGSIPVVGSIRQILGFDSILVGFGLDDDRVHSPNEKFELRCFEMGIKSHAAMLAELAQLPLTASRGSADE